VVCRGVAWRGVVWRGVVAWPAASGVTSLMCELALALGIASSTPTTATTGRLAGAASSRSAGVVAVEILAKPTHNPLCNSLCGIAHMYMYDAVPSPPRSYHHHHDRTITTMIVPSPPRSYHHRHYYHPYNHT
jgi:hypothetical protein